MSFLKSDGIGFARGADTTGRTLVALFRTRSDAEQAVRELKNAAFSNEEIGLATQDRVERVEPPEESAEKEGATAGAVSGGVVGGLLGLIGSLLVPGLGPVVLGGVLATTLTSAGIGAATGGLVGALTAMGIPERDARHFDQGLRAGGTLVTISARTDDRLADALAILEGRGADLGPGASRERTPHFSGPERRSGADTGYVGPERRLARR
jgi:uncharacterized membrane protein